MDMREFRAIGMSSRFERHLTHLQSEQELNELSLPQFLADWKLCDSLSESPDKELYVRFDDYVQLLAVSADIGGTIGSTSRAEPIDLLQLSTLDPDERSSDFSEFLLPDHDIIDQLIDVYLDESPEPPVSIREMVTVLCYSDLIQDTYWPATADGKTADEVADLDIVFDSIMQSWDSDTFAHLNIGIAFAKLRPDFYYGLGEFNATNEPQSPHNENRKASRWPLKREFHLTICRIWASLCRPDMAYLLNDE